MATPTDTRTPAPPLETLNAHAVTRHNDRIVMLLPVVRPMDDKEALELAANLIVAAIHLGCCSPYAEEDVSQLVKRILAC